MNTKKHHEETDRKKREDFDKDQQHRANTESTTEAQEDLPIEGGYDHLTVEEAKKELDGLSEGELKKIRSYKKKHKNRKTLVELLDRKIGDTS